MAAVPDMAPQELVAVTEHLSTSWTTLSGLSQVDYTWSRKRSMKGLFPSLALTSFCRCLFLLARQWDVQMFSRKPNSWTLENGGYNTGEYENASWWWKGILLNKCSQSLQVTKTHWLKGQPDFRVRHTETKAELFNFETMHCGKHCVQKYYLKEKNSQYIKIQYNWSLS